MTGLRIGVALAVLVGAGCDGGGPLEVLEPQFVGSWEATTFVVGSPTDPAVGAVDLLADGGFLTYEFFDDLRLLRTERAPGVPVASADFGELTLVSEQVLEIHLMTTGVRLTCIYIFDGDTLRLLGDSFFDFDGDGEAEPAAFDLVLVRV